jgi:hypothetical protein
MKKRLIILAGLLAFMLCVSGCAKSSGDGDGGDGDVGDIAGTWTGSLKSTADPAEPLTLPIVITIGKDGSASISWHYANEVSTYKTDSCEVNGNEISFAIEDTFDTHAATPASAAGTLSFKGSFDGDDVIEGSYSLVFDTAGIAGDSGTIKVSNDDTRIVGTWMGVYQTSGGHSDIIRVEFTGDHTFAVVSSEEDFEIFGTWSLSGTAFTASSATGTLYDDDGLATGTFGSGTYGATANGSCLTGGVFTVHSSDPEESPATGGWSLGKVFD